MRVWKRRYSVLLLLYWSLIQNKIKTLALHFIINSPCLKSLLRSTNFALFLFFSSKIYKRIFILIRFSSRFKNGWFNQLFLNLGKTTCLLSSLWRRDLYKKGHNIVNWDLGNPTHLCRERGRRRRRRNTGVVETIIAQIGLARLLLGLLANIRFQWIPSSIPLEALHQCYATLRYATLCYACLSTNCAEARKGPNTTA